MDGFKYVSYKKARRGSQNKKKFSQKGCTFKYVIDEMSSHATKEMENYQDNLKLINNCRIEIKDSEFWINFTDSFVTPDEVSDESGEKISNNFQAIVSYGIGKFLSNPIARYQFAFLLLLADYLKINENVYLYDPIWGEAEREIIKKFNLKLIEENEECKRKIAERTLVVMLHCGKAMYDNLLSANWDSGLENLVIIGNAFSSYSERLPMKQFREESPYICDIIPFTKQHMIKNSFTHKDIFNDTCCLTFPSNLLMNVPDDFWVEQRSKTTINDDVEIITKEKTREFVT